MERHISLEPISSSPKVPGSGRVQRHMLSLVMMLFFFSLVIVPGGIESALAAEPIFQASQAVSAWPQVQVYLDVVDGQGAPLSPPPEGGLKATAEGRALPVRSVRSFADTGQGVGYVFLVDVSRSLGESELAGMRKTISSWVDSCGDQDRFALVSFGSDVRVLQDFTAEKEGFLARVGGLHPTDMLTSLHGALLEAQRLGGRQDPDLPPRRVVIVLSDGKNESLYGETAREVLRDLREASAPIFALGYYHPPFEGKKEYLQQLARFARASGGAYFRPGDDGLGPVFDQLRSRIDNTWVVALDVADLSPEGQNLRIQVGYPRGGRFLSDAFDVRLIPPLLALSPVGESRLEKEPVPAVVTSGEKSDVSGAVAASALEQNSTQEEERVTEPSDEGETQDGREKTIPEERESFSPVLLGGGFLLLLGLFLLWALARKAGPKNGSSPDTAIPVQDPVSESGTLPEPEPSSLSLRLEVIRGRRVVRSFRLLLSGNRTLGRSEENDISIVDDRTISARHCELVQQENGLAVRDLGSTNGTFVNNFQIGELTAIRDGDMLRIGQTSIQFVFEKEQRPVGGGL